VNLAAKEKTGIGKLERPEFHMRLHKEAVLVQRELEDVREFSALCVRSDSHAKHDTVGIDSDLGPHVLVIDRYLEPVTF
jgi:hypothetical protein